MNTFQKILTIIGLVILSQVPSIVIALLGYNNLYVSVILFIVMIILIIIFYDDIFDSKNVLTEIQQVRSARSQNTQLQSAQSIYRNNLPKLTQRSKTSNIEIVYDENGIQMRRNILEQQEQKLYHQLQLEYNEHKRNQIQQALREIEREKNDLNEVERIRRDLGNKVYSF